jgi:membrane-associated phospholipid phosphatase
VLILGVLGCFLQAHFARAQTGILNEREAKFASNQGLVGWLAVGSVLPAIIDGRDGVNHSLRTADAIGTSLILAEGMKRFFTAVDADHGGLDGFPSAHATAAFAIATMESHYHRIAAPLFHGAAFLVADSRVTLRAHSPREVIAGGILGTAVALGEIVAPRGLLLSPFITPETAGRKGTGSGMIGLNLRY